MIKNPNQMYKERRFQRIFGSGDDKSQNKDFCVECFIRIDKRRVEAVCVFNEYLMYLRQKGPEVVYDDNYFRLFWNCIGEIKSQFNLAYVLEITLRDQRKIYIEFKKDHMAQINQRLSNLLRFHHESPAMLELVTQLHREKYGMELKDKASEKDGKVVIADLNEQERRDTNLAKDFESKLVVEGNIHSSDSEDEDPLKIVKKDSFTVISQMSNSKKRIEMSKADVSAFIEHFNDVFCHTSVEPITTSSDLFKNLGLKIFDNTSFKYCTTYPTKLVLPVQMLDYDLLETAKFRTKGRMPILSFVHRNSRLMYRSGQISAGFFSKRSEADEMLLYYLGQPLENINREDYLKYSNMKKNMGKKTLKICDARSYAAAYGNKLMGAGFEDCEKYYVNCVLSFHGIANIHDVRNSSNTLFASRSPLNRSKKGFYKALGESKWYEYIADILEFAVEIAETLNANKQNVLIHCSDGWDRTSQMAAIVQILLDRKFRTIGGFLRLIEKDFSEAGFQFSTRSGFYNNRPIKYTLEINERREIYFLNTNESKESPIFLQFLDCVRQIVIQKPEHFEFGLDLINEIAYCLQLGIFKELMFDCEAVRMRHAQKNSVFDYFQYHGKAFMNPNFDPSEPDLDILEIKTDDFYFRVWDELIFENVPIDERNLLF